MPRKPRIEYVGALYHLMCRGDRREAVFRDDRDHQVFIETFGNWGRVFFGNWGELGTRLNIEHID